MAGQKGRDILLKLGQGTVPETYLTVAGIRSKTLAFIAQKVDATSADSPEAWRELLAGAGLKEAEISGAGVFKDAPSDALVRASFFAQAVRPWQVVVPDFGTLTGPFLITRLEYSGSHDGEAQFALTLASAGALVWEAL